MPSSSESSKNLKKAFFVDGYKNSFIYLKDKQCFSGYWICKKCKSCFKGDKPLWHEASCVMQGKYSLKNKNMIYIFGDDLNVFFPYTSFTLEEIESIKKVATQALKNNKVQ